MGAKGKAVYLKFQRPEFKGPEKRGPWELVLLVLVCLGEAGRWPLSGSALRYTKTTC